MAAVNKDHQQSVGLDPHSYRECAWGLVFANTVIESLTFTNGVSMQPENPNQNQITTFNAYTRSIVDVCGAEVMKRDLVTHTSNTDETVTARPGLAGGVSRDAKLREEMTKALIAKEVPKMAKIFLLTCPSDWDRGYGPAVRNMLDRVERDGLQPPERTWRNVDVQRYVHFNWELAEIVDHLVDTFKLPMPGGKRCILWEDNLWQMRRKTSGFN
ncbi:hypothetical protein N0V92_002942 [Colletotrichum tropicale]|nr:hypothetical protein N0V92_002942 [Colletotrichum tropicale]